MARAVAQGEQARGQKRYRNGEGEPGEADRADGNEHPHPPVSREASARSVPGVFVCLFPLSAPA